MRRGVIHPCQPGVADEVFFEVGINRALTAQPREGPLCMMTQLHLGKLIRTRNAKRGARRGRFDVDLDEGGAGSASHPGDFESIQATRGDDLGLSLRIGHENFKESGKIGVGQFLGLAAEEATDVTARNSAEPGDIALVQMTAFGPALQGNVEIAHDHEWTPNGNPRWTRIRRSSWPPDGVPPQSEIPENQSAIFLSTRLHDKQQLRFGNMAARRIASEARGK